MGHAAVYLQKHSRALLGVASCWPLPPSFHRCCCCAELAHTSSTDAPPWQPRSKPAVRFPPSCSSLSLPRPWQSRRTHKASAAASLPPKSAFRHEPGAPSSPSPSSSSFVPGNNNVGRRPPDHHHNTVLVMAAAPAEPRANQARPPPNQASQRACARAWVRGRVQAAAAPLRRLQKASFGPKTICHEAQAQPHPPKQAPHTSFAPPHWPPNGPEGAPFSPSPPCTCPANPQGAGPFAKDSSEQHAAVAPQARRSTRLSSECATYKHIATKPLNRGEGTFQWIVRSYMNSDSNSL